MACTPRYFAQIFDSSIVEKPEVRFTFMDLLVLADPDGVVDMTHEAIARRTNRPLEIIRATIAELEALDPQSRTPDEDGARLKRLDTHRDWGWCIINFDRFHKLASEEARRAKTRERVTKYRDKVRGKPQSNAPVTPSNAPKRKKRHTDVDVDVDVDAHTDERNSLPPGGGDHIPDSGKKPPGKPKAPAEPKPPAPYRELTDYFCSRWAETHAGEKYPFNGRDGKNCATIWEYVEHNLDKAKKIIDTFLICREPFFAGHKLAKLAADLPKFIAAAYPPAPSPKPRMTVAEAMARTKRIREQQELENGIDNRRRNPD